MRRGRVGIALVAGGFRSADGLGGGFASDGIAIDALHHTFAGGIGQIVRAQLLEQRERIRRHAKGTAGEAGGIPLRIPTLAEHGEQRMNARAHVAARVGVQLAARGRLGALIGMGSVPQRLKSGHGGRYAAGSAGLADQGDEVRADVRFVIVHQTNGSAVSVRAIGRVFEGLNEGFVAFGGDVGHKI